MKTDPTPAPTVTRPELREEPAPGNGLKVDDGPAAVVPWEPLPPATAGVPTAMTPEAVPTAEVGHEAQGVVTVTVGAPLHAEQTVVVVTNPGGHVAVSISVVPVQVCVTT